jgi:hypothetical protein
MTSASLVASDFDLDSGVRIFKGPTPSHLSVTNSRIDGVLEWPRNSSVQLHNTRYTAGAIEHDGNDFEWTTSLTVNAPSGGARGQNVSATHLTAGTTNGTLTSEATTLILPFGVVSGSGRIRAVTTTAYGWTLAYPGGSLALKLEPMGNSVTLPEQASTTPPTTHEAPVPSLVLLVLGAALAGAFRRSGPSR